ncbi:hypothetical protein SDC9_76253 [bioreactor metagenome]|uniref:Prepilin-type N-terminal cleavage/methylation domain-containing protein n=1 Tax=bioreactor metagenome TaxID=1076179 RepID=A0A644YTB0_9ZZZZ
MQLKRNKHNQNGFTLIELVIAMALTVLLLTGLFTLLSTSLKAWSIGLSKTDIQYTARFSTDMLTRDLQFATQIIVKNPKSLDLYTNKYSITNQKITYSLDNGILYKDVNDGSPRQPLTGGNNSPVRCDLSFEDLTPAGYATKTVGITLTATDTATKKNFTIETAVSSMLIR